MSEQRGGVKWIIKREDEREEGRGDGRTSNESTSDGEFISAKGAEAPAGQGKMTEIHNESPRTREREE